MPNLIIRLSTEWETPNNTLWDILDKVPFTIEKSIYKATYKKWCIDICNYKSSLINYRCRIIYDNDWILPVDDIELDSVYKVKDWIENWAAKIEVISNTP